MRLFCGFYFCFLSEHLAALGLCNKEKGREILHRQLTTLLIAIILHGRKHRHSRLSMLLKVTWLINRTAGYKHRQPECLVVLGFEQESRGEEGHFVEEEGVDKGREAGMVLRK